MKFRTVTLIPRMPSRHIMAGIIYPRSQKFRTVVLIPRTPYPRMILIMAVVFNHDKALPMEVHAPEASRYMTTRSRTVPRMTLIMARHPNMIRTRRQLMPLTRHPNVTRTRNPNMIRMRHQPMPLMRNPNMIRMKPYPLSAQLEMMRTKSPGCWMRMRTNIRI